jgi:hypothetical protein
MLITVYLLSSQMKLITHVFQVDLEVDRGPVPVALEEVIQHVSC